MRRDLAQDLLLHRRVGDAGRDRVDPDLARREATAKLRVTPWIAVFVAP